VTFDEYSALASVTAPDLDTDGMLLNGALGLVGEAGEVADLVKKYYFQGHVLPRVGTKLELGDVLWYVALTARAIGCTLEEVAAANIEKLRARYPDGKFDAERSRNRGG